MKFTQSHEQAIVGVGNSSVVERKIAEDMVGVGWLKRDSAGQYHVTPKGEKAMKGFRSKTNERRDFFA